MCGRFVRKSTIAEIAEQFHVHEVVSDLPPSYNIAPTQDVVAIIEHNGQRRLGALRWGLIPSWAKDQSIGNKLINARAETINEKPSFKNAFRKRRCLIIADGFYEWKKVGKIKIPYYIYLKSDQSFAMAGLYETWHSPEDQKISSCTIITTTANNLIRPIHSRMPVIFDHTQCHVWLNEDITSFAELSAWLVPYSSENMMFHQVSMLVNSVKNNSLECIQPY